MDSSIWLTNEQMARLRADLLRIREELRATGPSGEGPLRLALIESALTRISRGTYGECVDCEEPIAFPELQKRPETPFCAECNRTRSRGVHRQVG